MAEKLNLYDIDGNLIEEDLCAEEDSHGLMCPEDKVKLSGIQAGAEVNQNTFSNVKVGPTTVSADSKTDTLELVAGNNVTITPDATNDKITIAATDTNTHYTAVPHAGSSSSTKATATTNGNTYINIVENSKRSGGINIKGSGATTVTSDANGIITISSTDNDTKYTHPSYTAQTGVPTANATLTHGGTFTVGQTQSDASGHVTAVTSRTYTLPTETPLSTGSATGTKTLAHSGTFDAITGIDVDGHKITPTKTTFTMPAGYTHPSYTARTGVPTANATLAHGGTFTVTQPVSDATGHITAMNSRTYTLPKASTAYCTCDEAADVAAKELDIVGNTTWELVPGNIITVVFSVTNTAENPTFNVAGTGAKPVYYANAQITDGSLSYAGYANRPMNYMYNGTAFVFIGWGYDSNTTYTNVKLGHGYATCTTAASTTAKVGTLSSYTLVTGGIVAVKFTYDVPASATLNINSKGAKSIYHKGAAIKAGVIKAGDTATFIYSTRYHLISIDRADMTGATSSAAGTSGYVPAPAAGKQDSFLKGDGTWAVPSNTTYSAGAGLTLSGNTFKHTNSIPDGTIGEELGDRTLKFGESFNIPNISYDMEGHINDATLTSLTLPNEPVLRLTKHENTISKNITVTPDSSKKASFTAMTETIISTAGDSFRDDNTTFTLDLSGFATTSEIASAMVFKGTLGTGGTITALPTASASTVGDTYKVITAGTYANSEAATVGDVYTCNADPAWVLIPSGDDEAKGTVTSVATGVGLTGGTISTSGTIKAKLRSETALTVDSAAATTTSGRVYPVAVDKSGYLSVNVPWTDTNPSLSGGASAGNDATVVGGVTVNGHAVTVGKKTLTAGSNVTITGGTNSISIAATNTDTKVTAVDNHYAPVEDTTVELSVDASSTTAASWGTTSLVTGVNLKRDAKGHVVGVSVDSVKMPSNPDTNTKNTAGSTDTSNKIFLVGATSQASSSQTYSHGEVYVGTNHHLYSNSKQVVNLSDTQALTNKTYNGYTLAEACSKGVVSSIGTSSSLPTSKAVKTYVDTEVAALVERITYLENKLKDAIFYKNDTVAQ